MENTEKKIDFHKVEVWAIGNVYPDNSHRFVAFFKDKSDAIEYLHKHSPNSAALCLMDLSYTLPEPVFKQHGDFFVMR